MTKPDPINPAAPDCKSRCVEVFMRRRDGLTRTSSAAATGSAADNLQNCFGHKKCERAAGRRRLQRFVRPIAWLLRGQRNT
jgi:hypothetical protein